MKKYKKLFIALATPILIYFIWGYFGFVGAWIPGKYDAKEEKYNVLWGLLGNQSDLDCYEGMCRIKGYTPFKEHALIDSAGKVIVPFAYKDVRTNCRKNQILTTSFSGKKGIYSWSGKKILAADYSQIYYPFDSIVPYFVAEKDNRSFLIFPDGIQKQKDYIYYTQGTYKLDNHQLVVETVPTKKLTDDDKKNRNTIPKNVYWGILTDKGEELLPMIYSTIYLPYDRLKPYIITNQGTTSTLLYSDGKKVKKNYLVTDFDQPSYSNKVFILGGLKTTDLDKNLWTTKKYQTSENPEDKNIYVNINKNSKKIKEWFALYDEKGELLPLEYDKIDWLQKKGDIDWDKDRVDFFRLKKNGKLGVYNSHSKKWILPLKFNDILNFNEELPLIKARKNNTENYSYYDLNGNLIISENLEIEYQGIGYLFFYKNGNRYKLSYNKDKQKFTWHKL